MKDFYDLLPGRNAAKHGFSERLFFDASNESFGDLKIDIGFKQSQPHMAQRGIDVRFTDGAVTTQLFENVLKFVRELGKHGDLQGGSASPKMMSKLTQAQFYQRIDDNAFEPQSLPLFFRRRYRRGRSRRAFFNSESPMRFDLFPLGFRADNHAARFLV